MNPKSSAGRARRNILAASIMLGLASQANAGAPPAASADDLAQLKAMIEAMEQRHQAEQQRYAREVAELRTQVQSLSSAGNPGSDTEERFEELEDELAAIQDQQDSLAEEQDRVSLTAYATIEYDDFDNTLSEFDARNIELLVDAQVTDRLSMRGEIEFERTAKTSGGNRAGEVEVEQGWVQYDINRYFNPRAGVVLVPFGKYNLEHFDPSQDLTDRPIMARRIVPTTWAEAGAGFLGSVPVGSGNANYEFYFINGLTDIINDRGLRSARAAFGDDNNNSKAAAGRVEWAPNNDFQLGLSGYSGEYSDEGTPTRDLTGVAVDLDYTIGNLELVGEWVQFDLDAGLNDSGVAAPEELSGFYAQANYHFFPSFLDNSFFARGFSNPTFTASVRYGEADISDDGDGGSTLNGDNHEERLTVGLNYRPTETFVVKLEHQWNDASNESLERGSNDGVILSATAAF